MTEANGALGRRLDTEGLLRPDRVTLDERRGTLTYNTAQMLVCDVNGPTSTLLDSFVRLSDATAAEIHRFAQRNGVLNVDAFDDPGPHEEALALWREWSGRARAILSIAAQLHNNETGRLEDWTFLRSTTLKAWKSIFAHHKKLTLDEKQLFAERRALADALNHWLLVTRVRPCFTWMKTSSGIGFTNVIKDVNENLTLAGALGLQLVFAVGQARAIATCAACSRPYIRHWFSPRGRRNFCTACGIRAAWRISKQQRRAEIRQFTKPVKRKKAR